jgi:hypothetical protein
MLLCNIDAQPGTGSTGPVCCPWVSNAITQSAEFRQDHASAVIVVMAHPDASQRTQRRLALAEATAEVGTKCTQHCPNRVTRISPTIQSMMDG